MSELLVHPKALPAAPGTYPQITRRPPGMPPLPPEDPVKRRILIVENDADSARLMEFVLNLQGYDVTTVGDLASASALVRTVPFGQIVLDISLPDGSGLDLLALVRRELKLTTPVTVVSGLRQQRVHEECMAAGATDFVSKPFSPSELVMRLGKWTRS
jgi:two-component system phosphate regulon response regulator PhoB